MTDRSKPVSPDRRLAEIVREVKIAAAERNDVVVDMRDADRARLELLAEELRPVFEALDANDDRFDFGISSGQQPRLWVDAVAHVHMGRDRRIFRFVRDTRLGRVIVSDTADLKATADAVSRYVAERVIERERIMAGDFETMKARFAAMESAQKETEANGGEPAMLAGTSVEGATTVLAADPQKWGIDPDDPGRDESSEGAQDAPTKVMQKEKTAPVVPLATIDGEPDKDKKSAGFVLGASWFILGSVAGVGALLVAFWDRIAAVFN